MKLKIFVKLGEILLGKAFDDENRADMYLPLRILSMGSFMLIAGITLGVFTFFRFSAGSAAASVFFILFGITALLCWKNQTINILDEETFQYSTFLGNKKTYRFSDIKRIRKNKDSMTMYVADGKVHMESSAILSEKLISLINKQLESLYGTTEEQ